MTARGRLLILSFSPIISDARVLKQIAEFSTRYDVTTCGYGPAPAGVAAHIEMPRSADYQDLYGRFITLKWYDIAYWRISAVRWVREHLQRGAYDVVLANEPEAVPVSLWLKPRWGVHADLHEYTPRLNEEYPHWKRRIKPFHEWLCRRYVTRADSWTTVSNGLVREYEKEFGFHADLVTNATPYVDLDPTPVGSPLRLIHAGACLRNRNITTMIDAVELATTDVTLDFYLTPNHPDYLEEVKDRAAEVPGVRVHDAVPYNQLNALLNGYDVGVHLLPPTNFNNTWALPNKLFDFVQARLAVLIGPSPEMAEYVTAHGFGVVAQDFSAEALAAAIDSLDPAGVARMKSAASAAAREMSAESQVKVWAGHVDALFAAGGAAPRPADSGRPLAT